MFKVNNKDTKTMPRFGVFIVNFEHISHLCPSVSIVNSGQVNAGWVKHAFYVTSLNQYMKLTLID